MARKDLAELAPQLTEAEIHVAELDSSECNCLCQRVRPYCPHVFERVCTGSDWHYPAFPHRLPYGKLGLSLAGAVRRWYGKKLSR